MERATQARSLLPVRCADSGTGACIFLLKILDRHCFGIVTRSPTHFSPIPSLNQNGSGEGDEIPARTSRESLARTRYRRTSLRLFHTSVGRQCCPGRKKSRYIGDHAPAQEGTGACSCELHSDAPGTVSSPRSRYGWDSVIGVSTLPENGCFPSWSAGQPFAFRTHSRARTS